MDYKTRRSLKKYFSHDNRLILYVEIADFVKESISPDFLFKKKLEFAKKHKHSSFYALDYICKCFSNGSNFSSILTKNVNGFNLIPKTEALLISASESVGRLDEGLIRAKFLAEGTKRLKSAIINPLVYPMILMFLCLSIFIISDRFIFKELVQQIPFDVWPKPIIVFKDVCHFFSFNAIYIIPLIVFLFLLSVWNLPRYTGKFRSFLDKYVPPFNFYRPLAVSSFLISFSSLYDGGVSAIDAIGRLKKSADNYTLHHLNLMLNTSRRTKPIDQMIDTGLIDDVTMSRLSMVFELPNFSHLLNFISQKSIDTAELKLKRTAKIVSGLFLILTAIILLFFALSTPVVTFAYKSSLQV